MGSDKTGPQRAAPQGSRAWCRCTTAEGSPRPVSSEWNVGATRYLGAHDVREALNRLVSTISHGPKRGCQPGLSD
jgi:hypothetical protein